MASQKSENQKANKRAQKIKGSGKEAKKSSVSKIPSQDATKTLSTTMARSIGDRVRTHLLTGGHWRDIPFLLPSVMKKTQVVELRLITDYQSITTVATVAYATALAVNYNKFANNTDLKNVFDEVRPVRGKIYYIPRYESSSTITGVGGAAVDFANVSAFGSSSSMLQHDNHVMFSLQAVTEKQNCRKRFDFATATWEVLIDATPDENWQDTNAPVDFAWWKPYFVGIDVTLSAVVGYLVMEFDFQFRGLK